MLQRGRKGISQLGINVSGAPARLKPPTGLNARERALFVELINSTDVRHFRASDIPMLIAFVQSSLLSRKLARDPKKVADFEKATRTLALLSTRLRLNPHARADAKTIGRMQPPPDDSNMPWRREEGTVIGFGKHSDEEGD